MENSWILVHLTWFHPISLSAFFEDNLLKKNGGLADFGDAITEDEEMSPSLDNVVVCMWLTLTFQNLCKNAMALSHGQGQL